MSLFIGIQSARLYLHKRISRASHPKVSMKYSKIKSKYQWIAKVEIV